jgi:hypothetical protein
VDKNILNLQVFGDSKLTVNWMNDMIHVMNLGLLYISQQLKSSEEQFQHISFSHVYQELNTFADSLSKEALLLDINKLVIEEFSAGKSLTRSKGQFMD